MEKYIAFSLYALNEKGGHQPAGQDGEVRHVYLAEQVDALLKVPVAQTGVELLPARHPGVAQLSPQFEVLRLAVEELREMTEIAGSQLSEFDLNATADYYSALASAWEAAYTWASLRCSDLGEITEADRLIASIPAGGRPA